MTVACPELIVRYTPAHTSHALEFDTDCRTFVLTVTDTESYRDFQESYQAYNFVSELEIRTVRVLSRPYNEGTYCRFAGMARWPLTVLLVSLQQQFHTNLNSALFASRPTSWIGPAE